MSPTLVVWAEMLESTVLLLLMAAKTCFVAEVDAVAGWI
jgi:hypothetical protein